MVQDVRHGDVPATLVQVTTKLVDERLGDQVSHIRNHHVPLVEDVNADALPVEARVGQKSDYPRDAIGAHLSTLNLGSPPYPAGRGILIPVEVCRSLVST